MSTTGRFVWFEYVSSDASKAQRFFGELFGWSTKTVPMPDGDYTMIAAPDGRTIGGYVAAPDPSQKGASWLPYLQVASAAESTKQARSLGATVMKEPFKVGDLATMAVLADPHGAGFAVWQPTRPEPQAEPAVGHFVWNELASKNVDASVSFYSKLGGFTVQNMDMGPAGTYHLLQSDGQGRAGIMAGTPPQPHTWLPYVSVASADQSVENAKKLGATIVVPPTPIPDVGRFAILLDPVGGATGLLQPNRA